MEYICKYFTPHPYNLCLLLYTFKKDIVGLYNFEPTRNPVNEAESEREYVLSVYYTSTALEILGMQQIFALISSSVT